MKLFKYLPVYLAAATLMAGFSSCDQDLDVPPVILPEGGIGGDGSASAPLTTNGVVAYYNTYYSDMPDESTYYWATGYIVGCVVTTETVFVANDNTSVFSAPFGLASNILLAASPDETDYSKCIALQLPSGSVRSALNLMDNPGNQGREVTVYGYITKYLGLPGMRSVSAYNWGSEGVPGMDPAVFTKASSVTSGKAYALVAHDGSTYQAAKPASESANYGWLYNQAVNITDNSFKMDETNCFVFTQADNGYYYINDYYGRYMYMSGTYNSFQLSKSPISGDQTFFWMVTPNNDDTWTITNVGNSKVIQYSTEHTSYGAYSTIESGYILPMLFEKEGDAPSIGGGSDTPDAPQGTITVATALELIGNGYTGQATVSGIVSEIEAIEPSFGNATYTIKDALTDNNGLIVYRGYFLDGAKFTSTDQLKVGDAVVVSGELVNYNGKYEFTSGSKILSLNGEGSVPDEPSQPGQSAEIFSSMQTGLASMPAGWTTDNVSMADALSYVWSYDPVYGAKASAYVSGASQPSESWLVSPAIDLAGYSDIALAFEHAANYLNGNAFASLLGVYVGEASADKSSWTDITALLALPAGNDWKFVNSGNIGLDDFAGKTIQIAFRYVSNSSVAPTWEVKNIVVTGTK